MPGRIAAPSKPRVLASSSAQCAWRLPLRAVQEETKPDVRGKERSGSGQGIEVGGAGRKREEAEAQEAKHKGAAAAPQEK